MSYDEKCLELAEYFAGGDLFTGEQRKDLAQYIQQSVEDWLGIEEEIQSATPEELRKMAGAQ